jgi:hypothetical protein
VSFHRVSKARVAPSNDTSTKARTQGPTVLLCFLISRLSQSLLSLGVEQGEEMDLEGRDGGRRRSSSETARAQSQQKRPSKKGTLYGTAGSWQKKKEIL